MVEVFKTNVEDCEHAGVLLDRIHTSFAFYRANFDLDDCDRILRVECKTGVVDAEGIVQLLDEYGYEGEVLEDEIVSFRR